MKKKIPLHNPYKIYAKVERANLLRFFFNEFKGFQPHDMTLVIRECKLLNAFWKRFDEAPCIKNILEFLVLNVSIILNVKQSFRK